MHCGERTHFTEGGTSPEAETVGHIVRLLKPRRTVSIREGLVCTCGVGPEDLAAEEVRVNNLQLPVIRVSCLDIQGQRYELSFIQAIDVHNEVCLAVTHLGQAELCRHPLPRASFPHLEFHPQALAFALVCVDLRLDARRLVVHQHAINAVYQPAGVQRLTVQAAYAQATLRQ